MRHLTALLAAIMALPAAAASPVVADASQRVLGFYIGQFTTVSTENVLVISRQGYTANYIRSTGRIVASINDPWGGSSAGTSDRYFPTGDCSGPVYVEAPTGFTGGGVGRAGNSDALLYVAKNASRVTFTNASRLTAAGVCEAGNFYPGPFMEATPNDPAVTGIGNDPATPPLKIEVATIEGSSFDLFKNGFESARSGSAAA